MKVFMLGWEFPPFISGGLGTACYGLTRAMDQLGINITFLLPKVVENDCFKNMKMLSTTSPVSRELEEKFSNTRFLTIPSKLKPYATAQEYQESLHELQTRKGLSIEAAGSESEDIYGRDIFEAINNYTYKALLLAQEQSFDVIHAHDWMTLPAAMEISKSTGRPMIAHIHSTEIDRSGKGVNKQIYEIERSGIHHAQRVIAVSNFTRNILIDNYGISGDKVEIVYNAVDGDQWSNQPSGYYRQKRQKIVLFLGRVTMQKGPEYFIEAAKKVLQKYDDVKFIMAGSGDMLYRSIEQAAHLGIGHKVFFTGFLNGDYVKRIFKMADLYVMPSVSEPFGIAPLEALNNDVPVLISKQSGVSEVLKNALKVDFWDTDEMANKITAVLKRPALGTTLKDHGKTELGKFNWLDSAQRVSEIYQSTLAVC